MRLVDCGAHRQGMLSPEENVDQVMMTAAAHNGRLRRLEQSGHGRVQQYKGRG